jgi:hypothetical protein
VVQNECKPGTATLSGFVQTLLDNQYATESAQKLQNILKEDQYKSRFVLYGEIFTVQAAGNAYHQASTQLQHNGFIAPCTFSIMETLNLQRVAWSGPFRKQEISNFLELERKRYENANRKSIDENKPPPFPWVTSADFFSSTVEHCEEIVRKIDRYFLLKIWGEDAEAVKLFKVCRMFDPFYLHKIIMEGQSPSLTWDQLKPLMIINGFTKELLDSMSQEMAPFVAHLTKWRITNHTQKQSVPERADQAWQFWCTIADEKGLKTWWEAATIIALILPTSCEVERFFSVAEGTIKKTQTHMHEDMQETRHMLAYNGSK